MPQKCRRLALKSLRRKDTIGIILLGNEKVGKTGIVKRWLNDEYHDNYKPTVEDFYDKDTTYLGRCVNVALIDIAGSGQFPAMDELYIKRSDVIILTYEIGDKKSIESLSWYYENVKKYIGDKETVFAVAGAKCDKYEKSGYYGDDDVCKDIFKDLNKKPEEFLTSAKNNTNITELFDHVIGCLVTKMLPTEERMKQITEDAKKEEIKQCCVIV